MKKETKFNSAGFLENPDDWNFDIMYQIAEREGITLTNEAIGYIKLARKLYFETGTVPVLRDFSKLTGGDRKGKHLVKMFNGRPMSQIAKLGGMPPPSGC